MKFLKSIDNTFCQLEVKNNGYFSITVAYGQIVTRAQARKMAKDYWISFFEEIPGEMTDMGRRFGRRFRAPNAAAQFVLDIDGEFYGLDVIMEEENKIYICKSCGQIINSIKEFFPWIIPFLNLHLKENVPNYVPDTIRLLAEVNGLNEDTKEM
jgi:hypothetical protein